VVAICDRLGFLRLAQLKHEVWRKTVGLPFAQPWNWHAIRQQHPGSRREKYAKRTQPGVQMEIFVGQVATQTFGICAWHHKILLEVRFLHADR
jgi:hypothetical protein